MLQFCRLRRAGISPASLFLHRLRDHPDLRGLSIADRGRIIGEKYHQLSEKERALLREEARTCKYTPKKDKLNRPALFLREHWNNHSGNPLQRFKELMELFQYRKNTWKPREDRKPRGRPRIIKNPKCLAERLRREKIRHAKEIQKQLDERLKSIRSANLMQRDKNRARRLSTSRRLQ